MLLFREGNTGESSSISTNKWNWTVWRALFRPMGVRSWRKLWKTEVKLPPEGISMVVPKERLRIVVNSCPRFFFVSSPFSIERNDFPSPYSRRSSLDSVQRKRLKKKKKKKQSIFFNNYLNFPLSSDKIIPPNFATTSGENISDT